MSVSPVPNGTSSTGCRTVIKLPTEPQLDGVLEEDRPTVRNIIYVMHSFKMCKSWSVLPKNHGYEVVGMVDSSTSPEIELRDMDLLKRADPLRVSTVSARMICGPPVTFSIVVFLLRKSEPVILDEQEVVCIQRKRKFWNWGS